MTTTTARPIVFAIDGIEVGTGQLWDGILIGTTIIWSTDVDVVRSVKYRIECAIRRGDDAIVYINDSGKPATITWEIEE